MQPTNFMDEFTQQHVLPLLHDIVFVAIARDVCLGVMSCIL